MNNAMTPTMLLRFIERQDATSMQRVLQQFFADEQGDAVENIMFTPTKGFWVDVPFVPLYT